LRLLAVTALLGAASGPPWISIEYPANPYDAASRGAFLLVHAFHHGTPVNFPVSGTAEGIVNGSRRTVSLEFKSTSRPGVYALQKQWPTDCVWTLVLGLSRGEGEFYTSRAVVDLAANGQLAGVPSPTQRERTAYSIPSS